MRRNNFYLLVLSIFVCLTTAGAQVVAPPEINDNASRALQQRYLAELKVIGSEIQSHKFPYRFYFSRALDLDEQEQRRYDQRSIRFEKYNGRLALEITGNYYASYSADMMSPQERVRKTFSDVMLPMLKAEVPHFTNDKSFQSYALEISHHVRSKVLRVQTESPENIVLILPRASAEKLIAAKTPHEQQSALMEGQVFLDAKPFDLWLSEVPPSGEQAARAEAASPNEQPATTSGSATGTAVTPATSSTALRFPADPPRLTSPEALAGLQSGHQDLLARMTRELDSQAHFVSYAPPGFIAFHQGVYLQLSLTSTLDPASAGSQYKQAALAFDNHVAHLIRPVFSYFEKDSSFDGIDFSTSVRLASEGGKGSSEAVEFIFPFSALRCYQQYDCTGQQLLNSGFILINGERVGLDLQPAESGAAH
jgi:hypothetical protein